MMTWGYPVAGSIDIEFSLPGPGYIALGFGSTTMYSSDVVLGWVVNGSTPMLTDRWSVQDAALPQLDTDIGGTMDYGLLLC